MASVHWLTNKGLLNLLQGEWDDAGATAIRILLFNGTSRPTGIDTAAEVADINFVTDLLAATGVVEMTASGYSRQNLTRTNWTEDDTNDRVNADASNVTISAVASGQAVIGGAVFKFVTNDTDSPVIGVWLLDAPGIPTNGSDITLTITDLYRAAGAP
jgi:hypothetical protein